MLPPLLDISEIHKRLQAIFPEGTPQRGYCTREMAARTVFVMLYVGAVEGSGVWMGPKQVYRMGESQSRRREHAERLAYVAAVEKARFVAAILKVFVVAAFIRFLALRGGGAER